MEPLRGRGTSVWLVPEAGEAESLSRLIARLATQQGTPAFAPHVTLLPGLARPSEEVAETTETLLSDLETLTVALRPPEGRDSVFRCLIQPVVPTFRLVHAHALFRSAFAPGDETPFEPHLSLLYGTLPAEENARLGREIAAEVPKALRLSALEVVRTEGPVESWRSVARIPLPPADPATRRM